MKILLTALLVLMMGAMVSAYSEPRHALGTVETTEEGWLVVTNASPDQMAALCLDPRDQESVLGCASWAGPMWLVQPARSCVILIKRGLGPADTAFVIEAEKRHCREGAYHDTRGREIPLELRNQILQFAIPTITR